MLMLSNFCNSKDICSVGYGSLGCGASNEWYFGGPDNKWSVKFRSLVSTLGYPLKK